ncbi:MAG: hypothetical protein LC790_14890 [Actinobacteria bacterium]|nr:hypothetical protein [Actinomycetota bacterium]
MRPRARAVRSWYAHLSDRRALDASPAVGVKAPKVTKQPAGKGLTEEHLQRLLDSAAQAGVDDEAIVCLLALSGLRVSEVCDAQIEDLRREGDAVARCACAARAASTSGSP